jgi:hypothetical protein
MQKFSLPLSVPGTKKWLILLVTLIILGRRWEDNIKIDLQEVEGGRGE